MVIAKKTLRYEVHEQLVNMILSGELPADTQLEEQSLSEKLGISRTPLRDAILRLIQEGLIVGVPYKGNFVKKFSPDEVEEIYEVRKLLEVKAIQLAVRHMTDEEAGEISELVLLMEKAQEENDIEKYSALDRQFHSKIALFSRNRVIVSMLNTMDLQIRLIRQMANQKHTVVNRSQFERLQILEAISKRNETLAGMFMEAHIDNVKQDVISILQQQQ